MNHKLITRTTRLRAQLAALSLTRAELIEHCKEYLTALQNRSQTTTTQNAINRTKDLLTTLRNLTI